MTALAKPQAAAALEGAQTLGKHYLETLNLVERLHRQLLDVIKDELDRRDEREINSVQALLLFNVGDQQLTAQEGADGRAEPPDGDRCSGAGSPGLCLIVRWA